MTDSTDNWRDGTSDRSHGGCRFAHLGLDFDAYGDGWSAGAWVPTEIAQPGRHRAGAYGVIHDAAMNFAVNSALDRDRRDARRAVPDAARWATSCASGEVTQITRQIAWRVWCGCR